MGGDSAVKRSELPKIAKSFLSGRNGKIYRLYRHVEYFASGRSSVEFNVKIPRLLFGWKWLKISDMKMHFETEEEARAWIETHKVQPKDELKEIPL
jgi:hypothetical protein